MSNALAVAHVTQALALLIESNLRPEIDMAVSVETRKPPADPPTEPTITVFLYQVTHNPSMRNHDLPNRSSDGTLVSKPVAALDLNYVISAYGEENELVGQRLIGCVARIMREFPVLPADVVQEAAGLPYLAGSDLAEAEQRVRFTPLQMDIDETSKLWGMLHQTPYSLSMTYQASLVLIEGREEPERSRPVRRTVVTVGASGTPEGDNADATGGSSGSRPDGAGAPGVSVTRDGRGERNAAGASAADHGRRTAAEQPAAQERADKPSDKAADKPAAKRAAARKPAAQQKAAAKKTAATRGTAAKKQPGSGRPARGRGADGKES